MRSRNSAWACDESLLVLFNARKKKKEHQFWVAEQVLAVIVFTGIITCRLHRMCLKFVSPCKLWF